MPLRNNMNTTAGYNDIMQLLEMDCAAAGHSNGMQVLKNELWCCNIKRQLRYQLLSIKPNTDSTNNYRLHSVMFRCYHC
ncbi:hypothetical protein F511_46635 [Dorcoceras hygrometricum]|uniref:Uncharacterized protein n=1 Tax=Dorcoceras hygrometricum TaxID=472368 RepID=A0A2Z7A0D9_9LAMI|nr:hypothetical protein F511_46635 [Dorcoceras hygrometricum]